MTDHLATARERIEKIAFAMDPADAIPLLEAAGPLLDQHLRASFIPGAEGPKLGLHASGQIVLTAIAPTLGAGMDELHYRTHIGRLKALMGVIADDCRMRDDLIRQWVDHNSRRIISGNAITLKTLPVYVVDRLVKAVLPQEDEVGPKAAAAMMASLKSASLDQQGYALLVEIGHRMDREGARAFYAQMDPWTKEWLTRIVVDDIQATA